MDGGESPLDVLSRAATMLQENQQTTTTAAEESSKQKQLPTTKWKRERRSRAEYSRKSDPKVPEVFNQDQPDVQNSSNCSNGTGNSDAPLDMSVRQRGQPPSYAQTISNPGYRSSFRASVITPTPSQRDDVPSGISMCDPIIDEHFRRSLGKDYIKIFSNNNISPPKENPVIKSTPKINGNVIELMDSTGLSVDDHFAKALGDTWLKLNKKEKESNTNDKEAVMSV